jgi:hypothetical protein
MARQPKVQRAEIGFPCFRVSCLEHLVKPRRRVVGLTWHGLLRGVLRRRANQLEPKVDVCYI